MANPGSKWLVIAIDHSTKINTSPGGSLLAAPDLNEPEAEASDGEYKVIRSGASAFSKNEDYYTSVRKIAELAYGIQEARPTHVNLTVPYVPYSHFQDSTAYRAGQGYGEYLSALTAHMIRSEPGLLDIKKELCSVEVFKMPSLPVWSPPGVSMTASLRCFPFPPTLCGLCFGMVPR